MQIAGFKDEGFEKFLKALKNPPHVRIGVLKNNSRSDSQTNVEIGAKHEFGADGMPQRSFLRIPLSDHLAEYLDDSNVFTKDALTKVVKEGTLFEWVRLIGFVAEMVVQAGFDSGGFGKWRAWAHGYQSNTGQILVDTQQLRDSIISEVVQ